MNLAFYIEKVDSNPFNIELFQLLNDAVAEHKDSNFSVFYNDLDHVGVPTNFAMFNATELWSFTGVLVCIGMSNTAKAARVINKFKLLHMFDKSKKENIFNVISLLDQEHVKVITRKEEDAKEFFRITGVEPECLDEFSVTKILEAV
tara:strand:- start:119 stop:559 length:441 start_codon:yes stop_codon:yes gene_type:complete